jgi:hypothetical protein
MWFFFLFITHYALVDGGFCRGVLFWSGGGTVGVTLELDPRGACDIVPAPEVAIIDSTVWVVAAVGIAGDGGAVGGTVDTGVVVIGVIGFTGGVVGGAGGTGATTTTGVVATGPSWSPTVTLAWCGWVFAGGT